MNKYYIGLVCVSILFGQSHYYGSTTAPVVVAGGIINAKHIQEVTKKYKRKDCPVCKGKGWYMSGDGIKKIECTYCENDKGSISIGPIISVQPHSDQQTPKCHDNKCKPSTIIRR